MRWPFGPPHLTLKPSKKSKKKNNNKNKKTKKQKKNKQKKQKKKEKVKKHKNTPKIAFQLFSQNFFFGGVSKNCLFWQLGPENAHPQNTIKIGFQPIFFFEKKLCVTKRPFLDKKNPNPEISVIIFFCLLSLPTTKKTPKLAETPIFIVF